MLEAPTEVEVAHGVVDSKLLELELTVELDGDGMLDTE